MAKKFSPEKAYEIGESIGIDWNEVEFDSEALAAGMDVELEHGSKLGPEVNVTDDDPEDTARIAWAHLMESPDYYVYLAEMEEKFSEGEQTEQERARESGAKRAYTRLVSPGKREAPRDSPALQKETQRYLQRVVKATEQGASADEAFRQQPKLDDLTADDLINLLWENQHVGRRSLQKIKSVLTYGDFYDVLQALLQRHIWEQAVRWWGEQRTQEERQWDAPLPSGSRDIETVVRSPESKAAGLVMYHGHLYKEKSNEPT